MSTAEPLDEVLRPRACSGQGFACCMVGSCALDFLRWSSASVGSCPGRLFVEGSVKSFCVIRPYQDFSGQFYLLKLAAQVLWWWLELVFLIFCHLKQNISLLRWSRG